MRFRATPESRGCLRTSPPAARTAETVHAFRLFSPETAASLVSEAKLAAGRIGYKDRGVRLPTDDIVIEGLSGHHRDLITSAITNKLVPFAVRSRPDRPSAPGASAARARASSA